MGILSLVTAAALTVAAVAAVVETAVAATAAPNPTPIPVHEILAAPGGVLALPDGRQLRAVVHQTGGCGSGAAGMYSTGRPRRRYAGDTYTLLSQRVGPPCKLLTATGGGEPPTPTFVGFQAIRITTNGWKFTPDVGLVDLDESTPWGWLPPATSREAVAALGMDDGVLVQPALSVAPGAPVGVVDAAVAASSLAEVGWTGVGAEDLPIQAIAHQPLTGGGPVPGQAVGVASFGSGIDDLLVLFALAAADATRNETLTLAALSPIPVPGGCQCGAWPAEPRMVMQPAGGGTPGLCVRAARSVTPYRCDYLGKYWCETAAVEKYVATGEEVAADGTVGCEAVESTVQRPVSAYTPSRTFGAAEKMSAARA